MIEDCLTKLRQFAPACRLFATFGEADSQRTNPARPHDLVWFRYTREQMAGFAANSGWGFRYIGEWGHPRGQVMAEYLGSSKKAGLASIGTE
jgi:hypothetical protein